MLGMSVSDLTEYIEFAATQNPFLQKILANQAIDKYNSRAAMSKSESPYELENNIRDAENPRSSLLSQIKMTAISDELLEIAEYLIFEMDDNGYIPLEPEEAARDLSVSVEDVQECLDAIQGLEPAGIGAQDITECLQLQLKRRGMEDSLEYKIVSSYLAEVAREDIERIVKALKTDAKAVKDAVAIIKKLNPRPASTILSKNSERVIPELTATFEKNKLRLELNRGTVPGLKLYNPYENDFNVIKDPEARKFMQENINAAKNLLFIYFFPAGCALGAVDGVFGAGARSLGLRACIFCMAPMATCFTFSTLSVLAFSSAARALALSSVELER